MQLFESPGIGDYQMSDSSRTEEEILASRGFSSNLIKLRGYTSHGFKDRARDVLASVSIWDLELRIIPKDKTFRNHILYDYKDDRIPILGSNNQVMMISKDTHAYYDVELLYLPLRLSGKFFRNIPESELSIYEEESREEGVYWQGEIPGETPTSEILRRVSPFMLEACHIFEEDAELNEKSQINGNPYSQDVEIFYRPIKDCKHFDSLFVNQSKSFWELIKQPVKRLKTGF